MDPKWADVPVIYEEYKRAYDEYHAREMHSTWRHEVWYQDLYSPQNVERAFQNRSAHAKDAAKEFFAQLAAGQIQPNFDAEKNLDILPNEFRRAAKGLASTPAETESVVTKEVEMSTEKDDTPQPDATDKVRLLSRELYLELLLTSYPASH